jgi:UDP-N-acetylglucosamine diphosphorylase/glucosamine-1-phosphate N-acetyltransferase
LTDIRNNAEGNGRSRPLAAVVLAAGEGTRMPGNRAKVVYEVAGEPIVRWVVQAVREVNARPIVLVVGHRADEVRAVFRGDDDVVYAVQDRRLGTGHATGCARAPLSGFTGDVLVLAGDGPLIRPETIQTLVEHHRASGAGVTLATATVDDPTGYGRVIRDGEGRFVAIVEHANATEAQRAIREIYPSYACFDAQLLFSMLETLTPDESSGEYRITDVPALIRSQGGAVELVDGFPPEDVLSINTPRQLEEVDAILSLRMAARVEEPT